MKHLIRKILKEHKSLICVDCGDKTEAYFVKDEIWNSLPKTKRNGSMCLSCLEKRIGRKLKKSDFKNSDIHNKQPWWSNLKESEDDLEWAQELVDATNMPNLKRGHRYIIKLCPTPINPDTFIYKFNELYGESNIKKLINDGSINIFYNEFIGNQVNRGKGFIIYVNPYGSGISTGWDDCSILKNFTDELIQSIKILTLEEFLLTTIES